MTVVRAYPGRSPRPGHIGRYSVPKTTRTSVHAQDMVADKGRTVRDDGINPELETHVDVGLVVHRKHINLVTAIVLLLHGLGPASDDLLVQAGNRGTLGQRPVAEPQRHRVLHEVGQRHLWTHLSHPGLSLIHISE